ncbi:MAG: polyribonucleotide nucleotidyltransferase [Actinomycetota bacterium]|jgi:polyribonucleotide nucleotidyltransferase|nr:polyribonucleotide nucleotidyltransferase [Actinomycetota bacterium]
MAPEIHTVERKIGEEVFRLEAGRVAFQANGAVLATCGETTVLAAATSSPPRFADQDFFPLTVDVEERMYAAGKIPGGFFRREGRASEKAILNARLIDRPLRPSFPDGFRHEVHVVVTALAVDNQNPIDILSVNAASAAVAISDIPFEGPIGCVRLSHIDGRWVANPTYVQQEEATIELVVAGRKNDRGEVDIMMIEAGASEHVFDLIEAGGTAPNEELLAQGIEESKAYIGEAIELQKELMDKAGKPKGSTTGDKPDYPLIIDYSDELYERVKQLAEGPLNEAIALTVKGERRARLSDVGADIGAQLAEDFPEQEKAIKNAVRSLTKKLVRKRVIEQNVRLDGRKTDEVRPIWTQIGVIPRVHGSGLFTRGETQGLSIATLGMQRMEQMVDDLSLDDSKRYMHHYNFPPYSTGEAGFMRGPKRREIGHGALSEKAVLPSIPAKEDFPYAIRVVSEILSSNGSTSMASVCGTSLALMDAGVPMRTGKHVGGVAMGLIAEDGNFVTLTDILGDEDAFGDMDFKVAGTEDVVTALQLDTKISGIPAEVLRDALTAAQKARLHIIGKMNETIDHPHEELNASAPRVLSIKIPVDKIGELIGPKGKNINMITATTGVEIDIDEDGTIRIGSIDQESAEQAAEMIEATANPRMPEVGERIMGKVVKAMPFGAFVNIAPNRDGLVHISKLGEGRIEQVEDAVNVGDDLEVEVTEVDRQGRINLTPVAWLERQVAGGKTIEEARAMAAQGGGGGGRDRGPRREGGDRGGREGGRDRDRGPRREGGPRRERAPRRDDNNG